MKLKYKKMHPAAQEPFLGSPHAGGFDLHTVSAVTVKPMQPALLPTGIAVEIPQGHIGLLALRSSAPKKKGLFSPHGMGIIDADYRGELFVQVCALSEEVVVKGGERIAQLVIVPARSIAESNTIITGTEEVEELSDTSRGAGGFGSSGH